MKPTGGATGDDVKTLSLELGNPLRNLCKLCDELHAGNRKHLVKVQAKSKAQPELPDIFASVVYLEASSRQLLSLAPGPMK